MTTSFSLLIPVFPSGVPGRSQTGGATGYMLRSCLKRSTVLYTSLTPIHNRPTVPTSDAHGNSFSPLLLPVLVALVFSSTIYGWCILFLGFGHVRMVKTSLLLFVVVEVVLSHDVEQSIRPNASKKYFVRSTFSVGM